MRFRIWLLTGLGVITAAMFVGVRPPVFEVVEHLGRDPSVQRLFTDPAFRRPEALFTLFVFMLVAPLAAAILALVLASVLRIAASLVATLVRSDRAAIAVTVVGAVALGWAHRDAWVPWLVQLGAVVARAYLVAADVT